MTSLKLPAELTIYHALEIKEQLMAALLESVDSKHVELDLSEVALCDGSGLQLLISFFLVVRNRDIKVGAVSVSDYLNSIFYQYKIHEKYIECVSEELV